MYCVVSGWRLNMDEMKFLVSLSTLLCGFLCLPLTSLMCRILHLDEEDTHIMHIVCMPTAGFLIILGFLGVIPHG